MRNFFARQKRRQIKLCLKRACTAVLQQFYFNILNIFNFFKVGLGLPASPPLKKKKLKKIFFYSLDLKTIFCRALASTFIA